MRDFEASPVRRLTRRAGVPALVLVCCLLTLTGCAAATRVLTAVYTPADLDEENGASDPARIPFASIRLTVDGTGGLLVMTEQAADLTYWRSGGLQTIVLDDGDLARTEGLSTDLLMREVQERRFSRGTHTTYRVRAMSESTTRSAHAASGRATLSCDAEAQDFELPLITLPLYRCVETVDWRDAGTTHSVYRLSIASGRIWQASVRATPAGQLIEWVVARPWWSE